MATKFITNAELLREIHNSKKTFCSFLEPRYGDYDQIIEDLSEITDELIEEIRLRKSKPRGKAAVPIETIKPEDVVFRLMTFDHIPLEPGRRRRTGRMDEEYTKLPFAPFKHYILRDGELVEVCRSHWEGGFQNGCFNPNRGRINNRLGQYFLLMVERYGRRGNFRGYSYLEELKGQALIQLSAVGLQFNEAKSQNGFAYVTTVMKNSFVKVLNTEKRQQKIRDDLIEMSGRTASNTRQNENEGKF